MISGKQAEDDFESVARGWVSNRGRTTWGAKGAVTPLNF